MEKFVNARIKNTIELEYEDKFSASLTLNVVKLTRVGCDFKSRSFNIELDMLEDIVERLITLRRTNGL